MPDKVPVSVVIIAKNEEKNIKRSLEHLDWVDEIIVVDDESTDRTREIAESIGANVFIRKMDIEGRHRNWAYQKSRNKWVLSLDADEVPTDELKKEIAETVLSNTPFSALTIRRRNFIGDYWIKGGGLYPSPQLKLFKKDKFKWEEVEVHPRAFLEGECGHLKYDLLHYTYKDWGDFLRKLDKQTTLEARKWYKLSLEDPKKANYKMNVVHAIWRVLDRFIRAYIAKKGYRDGFIGFMIAYFASLYQIVSYAKYREIKKNEDAKKL